MLNTEAQNVKRINFAAHSFLIFLFPCGPRTPGLVFIHARHKEWSVHVCISYSQASQSNYQAVLANCVWTKRPGLVPRSCLLCIPNSCSGYGVWVAVAHNSPLTAEVGVRDRGDTSLLYSIRPYMSLYVSLEIFLTSLYRWRWYLYLLTMTILCFQDTLMNKCMPYDSVLKSEFRPEWKFTCLVYVESSFHVFTTQNIFLWKYKRCVSLHSKGLCTPFFFIR